MSIPAIPKQALCSRCQKIFSYTPRYFDGKEIFSPLMCEVCDGLERDKAESEAITKQRRERGLVFRKLGMPFQEPGTLTEMRKLPCPVRTESILKWKMQPKAPFLSGPSGVGKTRTMVELIKRLWIEEGIEFNFVRWHDWQLKLDASHRYGGAGQNKEITALLKWPLLAIDDVGKGKPSEHLVTAFFSVIDHRMARGMPTLITTKYHLAKEPGSPLEARLGTGSADVACDVCRRLVESSQNFPFILN